MDTKKKYSKPKVISYGNVEELTKFEGAGGTDDLTGSTS